MNLSLTDTSDSDILSTMMKKSISSKEIEDMIKPITYYKLIDEFVYNVIIKTNFAEKLAEKWINSPEWIRAAINRKNK